MNFWGKRAKITSSILMILGSAGIISFGVLFAIGTNYRVDVYDYVKTNDTYSTLKNKPKWLHYGVGLFNYGDVYVNGSKIDSSNLYKEKPMTKIIKEGSYHNFIRYWNWKYREGWYSDKTFYNKYNEVSKDFCAQPQRALDMTISGSIMLCFSLIVLISGIIVYAYNKKHTKENTH